MPGTPFIDFPLFSGPNDAGELRNYLNQFIVRVNTITGQWNVLPLYPSNPITGNITIDPRYQVFFFDASGGDIIATMPDPAKVAGQPFYFKKIDSVTGNDITFVGSFDQTVVLTNQFDRAMVISNGSTFVVFVLPF